TNPEHVSEAASTTASPTNRIESSNSSGYSPLDSRPELRRVGIESLTGMVRTLRSVGAGYINDGNKRTGSEERSDGRRRWVSRPTAMNNLPDSGDVVLGRPVDDRIGVWFDLARDVDEAICPGFG